MITDAAGVQFPMPVNVNYGATSPDPPLALPGPIIGFSTKEDPALGIGLLQIEVITNDCPCPSSLFIRQDGFASQLTLVYPTDAIFSTALPAHDNTMA